MPTKITKPGRALTFAERSKKEDELYKKGYYAYTFKRDGKVFTIVGDDEIELDPVTLRPINEPKVTAKTAQKAAVQQAKKASKTKAE